MNQETDNRVEQLQSQLAAREQLKHELSETEDSLNREVYRLELAEMRLQMAEQEIEKLESWTLSGIIASLLGDRIGRIDTLREECRGLERESQELARSAEKLQKQVEQINAQIASSSQAEAELQALCPPGLPKPEGTPGISGGLGTGEGDSRHRIEQAIEAGESLLTHLSGMYRVYSGLKQRNAFSGGGALIAGAMGAIRNRSASALTGQISESVAYLCEQVRRLELKPGSPVGAEILAVLPQIERFADPAENALGVRSDSWADLEILARNLVSELQDMAARQAQAGR